MASAADRTEALFSYGTLQLPAVQQAQFGRLLHGTDDSLPGYAMGRVRIQDGDVVMKSGAEYHPAIFASDTAGEAITGTLFRITPAELAAADDYEVDDYVRRRVTLTSGTEAWVYVGVSPDNME